MLKAYKSSFLWFVTSFKYFLKQRICLHILEAIPLDSYYYCQYLGFPFTFLPRYRSRKKQFSFIFCVLSNKSCIEWFPSLTVTVSQVSIWSLLLEPQKKPFRKASLQLTWCVAEKSCKSSGGFCVLYSVYSVQPYKGFQVGFGS